MKRTTIAVGAVDTVANLLTLTNAFLGFVATVHALQGRIEPAVWFILLAAIADLSDGFFARNAGEASRLGLEFDSLADVVSFGVAPAVLMYASSFQAWGVAGALVSTVPLFSGAMRLARFNVMNVHRLNATKVYVGLSIPPAALTLSSYALFSQSIWGVVRFRAVYAVLAVAVAVLMISRIEYKYHWLFHGRPAAYLLAGVSLTALGALLRPARLLFPLLFAYTLSGVTTTVLRSAGTAASALPLTSLPVRQRSGRTVTGPPE